MIKMIGSTIELERLLKGTNAEIIEVPFPVQAVHRDKFALWSETEDIAYVESVSMNEVWDIRHPAPFYAIRLKTNVFESIREIRESLGGKKIFFYAQGTQRANDLHKLSPDPNMNIPLRYALWRPPAEILSCNDD